MVAANRQAAGGVPGHAGGANGYLQLGPNGAAGGGRLGERACQPVARSISGGCTGCLRGFGRGCRRGRATGMERSLQLVGVPEVQQREVAWVRC